MTIPEPSLGPGTIIGGILLEQCIGRGGMGEVYVGTQLSMDRRMAVKVLSPALVSNDLFVKRFLYEMRMTALIEHPNIVTMHEAGEDEGIFYLAMTYVDGETVSDRMRRVGVIEEAEVLSIGLKITDALAFAWDQFQFLHRDIKPANIMIDTYGEVKLMDMGLAKSVSEDPSLTKTGLAMGTPHYMSPEQARGVPDLDCRSDMYALGGTMYHMLTGKTPFSGKGAVEIITKHALEPLTAPQRVNPALSSRCCAMLEALLAKDRDFRHPDWHQVRDDILRVLDGRTPMLPRSGPHHEVTKTRTHPLSEKTGRLADLATAELSRRQAQSRGGGGGSRALLLAAIIALVMILGVLIGSFFQQGEPPRTPQPPGRVGSVTRKTPPKDPNAQISDDGGAGKVHTTVTENTGDDKPDVPPTQQDDAVEDSLVVPPAQQVDAATEEEEEEGEITVALVPEVLPPPVPDEEELVPDVPTEPDPVPVESTEADRKELRNLLRKTGMKLLQARFLAAGALWSEGRGKLVGIPLEELDDIDDQIQAVTGLRERVLSSFQKDVGHEIMVDFADDKRRFLVTEVTATSVRGKELVAHGEIARTVVLRDLGLRELVRRLGDDGTPVVEMMRAVLLSTRTRPGIAFTALAKARSPLAMGMSEALLFSLLRRENPGVRRLRVAMAPTETAETLHVVIQCDSGLESVAPIALVPVAILDLSGSGVEDVGSLAKLPLRALNLAGCDEARNLSAVIRKEGIDVLVLSEEASQAARADVTKPMPLNLVKSTEWSAAIRKLVALPPPMD
ncbi:MAG: serine/threonine protein kinase [Lentisphaeria bacterium]|nr:serine/threonine protein kinase [Lentisphaeria bacterium]